MKKILFVNTTYGTGGAPKVARDLFDYLDRAEGFKAYFAYGRGPSTGSGQSEKNVVKIGNNFELFLHIFFVRFLGLEGIGSYFSTRKLINLIKKEKIDVVHLHNIHGYYVNFVQLFNFLKKQNIEVLWTLHDEWSISCFKAHTMGCRHCRIGEGECVSAYTYPKTYNHLFEKLNLKRKQRAFSDVNKLVLISPANWLAESIKKSFLKNYEVKVIPNGVDSHIFYPRENKAELRNKYNLPVDKKIVVFSANNLSDPLKGTQYILDLAKNIEDKNILFLGIGEGKGIVGENIKITGRINNFLEISELLGLSDIFCFPTLVETASIALLEAMACGLPIVGFKISALEEVVDEKCGILVKVGNVEALRGALLALLSDNEKTRLMNIVSRGKILGEYEIESFCNQYLSIY